MLPKPTKKTRGAIASAASTAPLDFEVGLSVASKGGCLVALIFCIFCVMSIRLILGIFHCFLSFFGDFKSFWEFFGCLQKDFGQFSAI